MKFESIEDIIDDFQPARSIKDSEKFLMDNKQFVIFGIGKGAVAVKDLLLSLKKEIICFLSLDTQISESDGIPVHHPSKIDLEDKKMIISSFYEVEDANELSRQFSVKYLSHFIFASHINQFESFSCSKPDTSGEVFYKYLCKNKELFNKVISILSDEYSKDMFKKIVNFRLKAFDPDRLEKSDLPYSSLKGLEDDKEADKYFEKLPDTLPLSLKRSIALKLAIKAHSYLDIISPENKNVIIDGGAYNGNSAGLFAYLSPGSKIYAFEPLDEMICKLQDLSRIFPGIIPVKAGLWKERTHLVFNKIEDSLVSSFVDKQGQGNKTISVNSIDEFVREHKLEHLDFIKMDVEGAEPEALEGAEDSIARFKPDLCLSIYHYPEHLWQIPLWVKENFPEYSIYIDHKSASLAESLCFATTQPL